MTAALAVIRVITDLGYLLVGGNLLLWALVWDRHSDTGRLRRLTVGGVALMIIATLVGPVVELVSGRLLGDVITASAGAALIVQLAALVAVASFLPDLVGPQVGDPQPRRWRPVVLTGLAVIIALTLSVQSDVVGGRWVGIEVVGTAAHVLATAAWLGGLLALVVVIMPRSTLDGLAVPMARFARVRLVSLVVLVVTGVVQVLTTAGPAALLTGYGVALLIKIVLLAAMVVVAAYGRTHVARVTFRAAYVDGAETGPSGSPGVRAQVVVLRTELALGLLVLVVTSVLVAVTP